MIGPSSPPERPVCAAPARLSQSSNLCHPTPAAEPYGTYLSSGVATQSGARTFAILATIFAIALIPLYSTPVLPLIDYNHHARYYGLANVEHSAFLSAYYQSNWSVLPNIGMDVIGATLLKIFPPLLGAKILSAMIPLTVYTARCS